MSTKKEKQIFFHERLANKIYSTMQQQGLEVKDLSAKSNLSISTIRSYLNKERTPSFYRVYLIAKALHISLDELAGFETSVNSRENDIMYSNEQTIHYLKLSLKQAEDLQNILKAK